MSSHLEDEFKGKFDPRVWRRLLAYVAGHRWPAMRLAFGGSLIAAIEGLLPVINGQMIDRAIATRSLAALTPLLCAYIGMFAIFAGCVWLFIRAAGQLATAVGFELRRDSFAKLQELSFSFFDVRPVGWLTSRLTSDCSRVASVLPWAILDAFWGTLLLAVSLVAMFLLDWRLALATCTILPILMLISAVFQRLMLHSSRQSRRTNSMMTASFNEELLGIRTTKALVREERNLEEFARLSSEMRTWMLRNAIQSSIYMPLVMTVGTAASAIALDRGATDLLAGTGLSIGRLVSFLQFAMLLQHPILELAQRFADILNASSAGERVTSLLATEPQIKDGPNLRGDTAPSRIREVRFDGVTFEYKPGVPVLRDFSLTAREAQTVALVGETGGGKSTIVSLACRFYEPTKGRVLVDGVDYRERGLHWLQSKLGVIQQIAHLFSGTVRENIRYGNLDASDAEVEAAARRVNAEEMIRTLTNGYDFQVGESGERLSTGQRQLVALARAVLRDPQIFVMDEATSSVDTATERLIQGGIEEVLRDRIAFVIAHRLSTIRRANLIVVIDDGRIVEQGTHRELIARRGRYFELYTHQYAAEREAELFG